jgi:uncharacterized membrane protein YhaH (DUF805 family)
MGFVSAVRSGYRNIPEGGVSRAPRSEYWWFALFWFLTYIPTLVLIALIQTAWPLLGWFLLVGVPMLSVSVRRLHDTDRRGWWMLIGFVPLAGLVLLVFYCLPSGHGPNRFGPQPGVWYREDLIRPA